MPPHADLSSLRFAICGRHPSPRELLAKAQDVLGLPILEGYGPHRGHARRRATRCMGSASPAPWARFLPGQRIAIVDDEGKLLPAGVPGEVVIAGPSIMRGYLNPPAATARTVRDGWLHTGDVGCSTTTAT